MSIPGMVYMVSPCGFHADYFDETSAPDWTEADHLSDVEVNQMMVRRMMANRSGK